MLGGDWTKSDTGFRGYPASWITAECKPWSGQTRNWARLVLPSKSMSICPPGLSRRGRREGPHGPPMDLEARDGHLTRLDCALDDRDSCVPLSTIRQAIEAGQCVTRADRMQRISSSSIHKGTPSGETLYLGSPQSQTMLRIYDKRLESQAKAARGLAGLRHPVGVGVEKGSRPGLWTGPVLPGGNRLARIHGRRASRLCGFPRHQPRRGGRVSVSGSAARLVVAAHRWLQERPSRRREGRPDVTQGETLGESSPSPHVGRHLCRRSRWDTPGWRQQIIAGKKRWKAPHRRLAKTRRAVEYSDKTPAVTRAHRFRGVRGCRKTPPAGCHAPHDQELSARLNIKPSTLYLWAAQGKIPCRKIHGLIRFEPDAITAWLRSFEPRPDHSGPTL